MKDLKWKRLRIVKFGEEKEIFYVVYEIDVVFFVLLG